MMAADAMLAAITLTALEKGCDKRTVEMVKARLLASDELMEDGALKPFVELVLRAIKEVATKGNPSTKHETIDMWLTVGGF
jgi:hypothetical protein